MKSLFTVVIFFLVSTSAVAEDIRIIGGAAAISTVFAPIKDHYQSQTGDRLIIDISDPSDSLLALEKGRVDLVSINALALESGLSDAKKRGAVIDPASLQIEQIAMSSLVVFLNKANKVSQLSKEQLSGIFTGKITNWREVGGDDRPIIVMWGTETNFLNKVFSERILDSRKVTAKAVLAGDHFELRQLVLQTPGAIAINTSGLIMPGLKVPRTPLLELPILVVTKGKASAKVERLISFYKKEYGFLDSN